MTAPKRPSRRMFLKAAAGLAGALLVPGTASAAGNPYYRALRYQPDNGFNSAQLSVLGQACNILAHRMLDPRMLAYARLRYRYYAINAPGRTFRNSSEFEGWFHHIQMQALRVAGFPPLYLYGRYDGSAEWAGRGAIGTVTAEYASANGSQPRYYTRGNFTVTLNTGLIANRNFGIGYDAAYWAGCICHEMLHNLGHDHPQGVYDGIFIRAYENAVWRNAQ